MLSFLDYTVKLVFLCRQKKYKKMDDSLWFVEGRIRLRHIHKIDFCQEKKFGSVGIEVQYSTTASKVVFRRRHGRAKKEV